MEEKVRFGGWLTINRKCNLRCKWCYARTMGYCKEDMNIETVNKAVELYAGLGVRNVILIGGEPTIHPDFLKIVEKITEYGMRPLLVTNGLRLESMAFAKEVKDAGVKAVTISLKSYNSSDYLKNTGRDAFHGVIQGIRNVNHLELPNKVSITICKHLAEKTDELLEALRKCGSPSFSLDMGRPVIYQGSCEPGDMTPKEMRNFIFRSYEKLDKSRIRFTIKFSIPFCLFPSDFISMLRDKNQIISGCQIYKGNGVIFDPQGKLLPCNHFCLHPLGELGQDFINAEEYLAFRRRSKVKEFYRKAGACPDKRCVDCADWVNCGAGCKVNWLAYKNVDLIGNFQERR